MTQALKTPLFMNDHVVAPVAESEPVENEHYVYHPETQCSTWLVHSMSTTMTHCGKAQRIDDKNNDD